MSKETYMDMLENPLLIPREVNMGCATFNKWMMMNTMMSDDDF